MQLRAEDAHTSCNSKEFVKCATAESLVWSLKHCCMRIACLLLLILACLDSITAFLASKFSECLCDILNSKNLRRLTCMFLLAFAAAALSAVTIVSDFIAYCSAH
jgi:hypothetical protein